MSHRHTSKQIILYVCFGWWLMFVCLLLLSGEWSDDGGGKQSTISKERKVTYTKNYSQSTTLNSLSVKEHRILLESSFVVVRFQVIHWFCFKLIDIFNCYLASKLVLLIKCHLYLCNIIIENVRLFLCWDVTADSI